MTALLRAAYAFYLFCVGVLVFSPGGGPPGGVIAWILDLVPSLGFGKVEVSLNVLMFVPLSLLGRWVFDRSGVVFWLVTGFLASLAIELVQQFVPGRTTTVSDVVANTSGAVLGAVAALGLAAWGRRAGR